MKFQVAARAAFRRCLRNPFRVATDVRRLCIPSARRIPNSAIPALLGLPACENPVLAGHRISVHSHNMKLTLPAAIETKLSPEGVALHLAIGLFVTEEATLGQAAEVAGLTQAALLKELGRRRVPVHYGPDELAEDLRVVEAFGGR